ncbi:MAG: hypothetical protein GQ550_00020 [Gammaproteobacteria bacterium]|nr:hypothetical protein [Gammaproteobacteria bacterium]
MSFIQKLLDKSGLAILLQPRIDDDKERQQTIVWINNYLLAIIQSVLDDIETEKLGFYPHPENQQALNLSADSLGYIQYIIKDKTGKRLELSQFSLVSCNSIKTTENYRKLKALINDAGYDIGLKEINIDGDGVETYEELDEYTDDFERYFVIHVSGW